MVTGWLLSVLGEATRALPVEHSCTRCVLMVDETTLKDAPSANGAAAKRTAVPEVTRDPQRTRRLILQSASALFAKYGPDATTVDQEWSTTTLAVKRACTRKSSSTCTVE